MKAVARLPATERPTRGARLDGIIHWLRRWAPPFERREFWAVQALVLTIAIAHSLLEAVEHLQVLPELGPLYLVPTSFYFIPIVYAALNFGNRGSLPTALWCALLTIPNMLVWHSGSEQLGEAYQMAIVIGVGAFVGHRVDRETQAHEEAVRREREARASEERYRALFDNAAEAILLLAPDGTIEAANAAAAALFGRAVVVLSELRLAELVGADVAGAILAPAAARQAGPFEIGDRQGSRWIESTAVSFTAPDGRVRIQAILRDVTLQRERQLGLETYAKSMLVGREDERRRIARELHDGPLQMLVTLWRGLDGLEADADGPGRQALAEARALAQDVADELRRFSRDLRPSVLDDLGLSAALKSEARSLAERSGLAVRETTTGSERRLAPETELMLLRIAQEALRNVERHAGATNVTITLSFRVSDVRLVVTDNGRGFERVPSVSELLGAGRLGIVGMEERARVVGARFSIRSRHPGGTTVDVLAPA